MQEEVEKDVSVEERGAGGATRDEEKTAVDVPATERHGDRETEESTENENTQKGSNGETGDAAAQKEEDAAPVGVIVLTCRKCNIIQCRESDLMQDEVNSDPSNGSYYLDSPLDWMQEAASDVQGKFNCPGCDARVGRLSWVGYEAMPGRWITPCIMLTRSKVDAKRFPEEYVVMLEKKRDAFFQIQEEEEEEEREAVADASAEEGADLPVPGGVVAAAEAAGAAGTHTQHETVQEGAQEKREASDTGSPSEPGAGPSSDGPSVSPDVAPPPLPSSASTQDDLSAAAPKGGGGRGKKGGGGGKGKGKGGGEGKQEFTDDELAAMDLLDLVKLVDSGDLDMDRLTEAMDKAAAKKKAEEKAKRDLTDPQVLMKAVAEEIGSREELVRFKKASGAYAKAQITCAQYCEEFGPTLRVLDKEKLLEHVATQIADEEKRAQLLAAVRSK